MGVDVLVAGADDSAFAAITEHFERWEASFSRFRAESELNRVNSSPSWLVAVSPLFAQTLGTALVAAAATRGLVDPTLGSALVAAGYDRDFALLKDRGAEPVEAQRGEWRSVRVQERFVFRPPGVVLDLNGVVKSLAIDEAVELLPRDGYVSAGGDIATRGATTVGLPGGDAVTLTEGGLATSGRTRRRWLRAGRPQHHLLDPATGRPSTSRWLEVTVAAGSCVAADVAAKAAFLLGSEGPGWLDGQGLPGRFVAPDGVLTNATWKEALAS